MPARVGAEETKVGVETVGTTSKTPMYFALISVSIAVCTAAAAAIALGVRSCAAPSAAAAASSGTAVRYPGDVVAECKALLGANSEQCPSPFPPMPAATESSPSCGLAVVGAAAGGLYMAMRLIETGTVAASEICVFEMSERAGGRLYSLRGFGRDRNLNVDAGGYRTWPQYTPVTHALIRDKLGLPVACYDENEVPCQKFNIMDATGGQRGFTTFVEEMMTINANSGVRFFPQHQLLSITRSTSAATATLYFAGGKRATITGPVVLNVPQRPLLEIVRASSLPAGVVDTAAYEAMHAVQSEVVTKLYLYYRVAWWRHLGLVSGDFDVPGDAQTMRLKGRYHDGDFRCDPAKAGQYDACHGFLLTVYAHDYSGEEAIFFRRFQENRADPVTIISNTTVEGRLFLQKAHDRLKDYHKTATSLPAGAAAPYQITQVMDAPWNVAPEFGVLATWNIATAGHGGGWHGWTDLSNKDLSMAPLAGADVHVVNEAFSNVQGWAEGTLQHADKVLKSRWNVDHPWPFTVSDSAQYVAQTVAPPCVASSAAPSGGSSSSGGGGGHICFTASAQLTLADGRKVSIKDAKVGDRVSTGDGKVGVVTEALVHQHDETLEVAVVATPHGELIGTPDHPVYANGTWLELSEAHKRGVLGHKVTYEKRHIDTFYNLEIDGDKPGESAHAYVVNGVVASGLGDNVILNTRFPRQNVWKAKVAEAA